LLAILTTDFRAASQPPMLRSLSGLLALALSCLAISGCDRLHSKPPEEDVYVQQKDAYLRDHVAAVSNRTGHVVNGEKLVVLEHGRRFLRVRDDRNETGWIEERYVVTQDVFDAFQQLHQQAIPDPVVATAIVRDDVAMHLSPGRDTEHFYMLKEGDKLQLLQRASTPKPQAAQAMPLKNDSPPPPLAASSKPEPADKGKKKHAGPAPVPGAPTIPMEDWWLARDGQNHVGWVLGRRFDVDVPDTISGYAENQRFVAVYVITTVTDTESGLPDSRVPVYLALLAPYRDGLPYDYSLARVFSWNTRKHRYETAFRERNLWGYLPVVLGKDILPDGPVPTFTLRVSPSEDVTIDPQTAIAKPSNLESREYRMEGETVKRVPPPGAPSNPQAARSAKSGDSRQPARRRHRR
jgi:hypothetical protein